MVTDQQVRLLMSLLNKDKKLYQAAAKAEMDEKTARKYRRLGKYPSQVTAPHTWRTRTDAFEDVWPEVGEYLKNNAGLQAKTLFDWLRREHPDRFREGQLRTFQRRVERWRAIEGPAREVMFPQRHEPGRLAQSDFSHMDKLSVTIGGLPFEHMIYHFVLTYSNWEAATVCFSESFESLSQGLQNALWRLGGVPQTHQTDSLTAAVNRIENPEEFTDRYRALLAHYGLQGRRTYPQCPNQNGDIEQRHNRFRQAVDQRLMLRGNRDFPSRKDYEDFIQTLIIELNAGREVRLREELAVLRRLPKRCLENYQELLPTVGPSSTIRVKRNVYSVHSRLIGHKVQARVFAEHIEVWLAGQRLDVLPRLRGRRKRHINYRHIIDWLVRKPGAFENYLYRDDLFPTSRFRIAYDALKQADPQHGHKAYLAILYLAATENETAVDESLRLLIDAQFSISAEVVKVMVEGQLELTPPREVWVEPVDLGAYDQLVDFGYCEPQTRIMEAVACL